MIAVVVSAGAADRVSEGLRAALGLGLRGEPVEVVLTGAAARHGGPDGGGDHRIARALATLGQLGRPARVVNADQARALARRARAVEVWSDGPGRGRWLELWAAGAERPETIALDTAAVPDRAGAVVERLFGAERVAAWADPDGS